MFAKYRSWSDGSTRVTIHGWTSGFSGMYLPTPYVESEDIVAVPNDRGLYCYKRTGPFINFGAWATNPKDRPGHGSYWSSNGAVLEEILGEQVVEVSIDAPGYRRDGFYITVKDLLALGPLPDGYCLTRQTACGYTWTGVRYR